MARVRFRTDSLLVLLAFMVNGCARNPLAAAATFNLAAEQRAGIAQASPHMVAGFANLNDYEFTCTIVKLEVSTTGETWQTVFTGEAEMKAVGSRGDSQPNVSAVRLTDLAPDEYHGVRVWFGSKATGRVTAHTVNGTNLGTTEYDADDFQKYSPLVFSTKNGKLSFPFRIEPGKVTYLVLSFDLATTLIWMNPPQPVRPLVLPPVTGRTTRVL